MRWLVTNTRESPWRWRGGARFVVLLCMALCAPLCVAQELTQGVRVEEAVTRHAVAMPDADKPGAVLIAVTRNGSRYFGIDPVTPAGLSERLTAAGRAGEEIYIKADARAPYADVAKVLGAAQAAGVHGANLLTSQLAAPEPGMHVSPEGLKVRVGPPWPSGGEPPVVQVLNSGGPRPRLSINNHEITWDALQVRLTKIFQTRGEKGVVVKADGRLPFAEVIRAIDVCRSAGATVVLATPAA